MTETLNLDSIPSELHEEILLNLDYANIMSLCRIVRPVRSVCNKDLFWLRKAERDLDLDWHQISKHSPSEDTFQVLNDDQTIGRAKGRMRYLQLISNYGYFCILAGHEQFFIPEEVGYRMFVPYPNKPQWKKWEDPIYFPYFLHLYRSRGDKIFKDFIRGFIRGALAKNDEECLQAALNLRLTWNDDLSVKEFNEAAGFGFTIEWLAKFKVPINLEMVEQGIVKAGNEIVDSDRLNDNSKMIAWVNWVGTKRHIAPAHPKFPPILVGKAAGRQGEIKGIRQLHAHLITMIGQRVEVPSQRACFGLMY